MIKDSSCSIANFKINDKKVKIIYDASKLTFKKPD